MNRPQTFNLIKFKPENLKSSDFIVIIGHRNCGKSTLIKDLLFKSPQVPFGRVIHSSEKYNHFYKDFIPSILIEDELNKTNIKQIFEEKKRLYKEKDDKLSSLKDNMLLSGSSIELPKKAEKKIEDNRSFIILEDCLYQQKESVLSYFTKLVERKELYQNLIFVSLVYSFGLSNDIYKKIDYVFIYRENIVKEKKRIYEKYCHMIPNFSMFQDIFEQCTDNIHDCLVIHLSNPSTNWMDKIYWYRADVLENIKLCDRRWWRESKVYKKIKDKDIKESYIKSMNQINEFDLR